MGILRRKRCAKLTPQCHTMIYELSSSLYIPGKFLTGNFVAGNRRKHTRLRRNPLPATILPVRDINSYVHSPLRCELSFFSSPSAYDLRRNSTFLTGNEIAGKEKKALPPFSYLQRNCR